MMKTYLLFCLLLASFTGASVHGAEPSSENPAYLVKVGLDADDPASPAAVPNETKSCEGVTFARNLKYGRSEQNVLDVQPLAPTSARQFRVQSCCSSPAKVFQPKMLRLMRKPRCRMQRCALPRATAWSA